jgi:hypothetical protein
VLVRMCKFQRKSSKRMSQLQIMSRGLGMRALQDCSASMLFSRVLPKFVPSRPSCALAGERKYIVLHSEDTGTMTGEEADAARTVLKN